MNLALAWIAFASQAGEINTLDDIRTEIAYVDRATRYFVAIHGTEYVIGEPVYEKRNAGNDVPQAFGKVEDCSTRDIACRSLSQISFIMPRHKGVRQVQRVGGVEIILTRTAKGWRGSATCQTYEGFGCSTVKTGDGPVLTYQYALNRNGDVTEIAIQYRSRARKTVDRHRLMPTTRKMLRLS